MIKQMVLMSSLTFFSVDVAASQQQTQRTETPVDRVPDSLAEMHDRYRPILIFAPTGDPRMREQVNALLAHTSELIDRQVAIVPFFHKYAGGWDGRILATLHGEEPALRRRFHVKDADFAAILLGKDGGEKLRSSKPISFEKLRDTIDSMPMRQHEMRSPSPR